MKPPLPTLCLAGLLNWFSLSAQTSVQDIGATLYSPKITTVFHKIGETQLPVKIVQYGDASDIIYINLHDDERSSVEAAQRLLEKEGGLLIKFENNKKRNIRFRLRGRYYSFDPNRMFSREGASQTLAQLGRTSPAAIEEVVRFGQRVLEFIPDNPSCVIALHNNTDGRFGVTSYLPGSSIAVNAKKVFENPVEDPDDIFLTTDSVLYERMAAKKFNTIWQDNENARRDGSLSVYCGEKNIRYVNCETQHGKTEQYLTMLFHLVEHIERVSPDAIPHHYTIRVNESVSLKPGQEIFFGDKPIGKLISVHRDDSLTVSGRMELKKDFTVYANTDFFLLPTEPGDWRIEIRIDPTREKLAPASRNDVISILVK